MVIVDQVDGEAPVQTLPEIAANLQKPGQWFTHQKNLRGGGMDGIRTQKNQRSSADPARLAQDVPSILYVKQNPPRKTQRM